MANDTGEDIDWQHASEETLKAASGEYRQDSVERIQQALTSKKIIFLAVPSMVYTEWMPKICHILSKRFGKIGYVSLIWSPKVVLQQFEDFQKKTGEQIPKEKFYFVESSGYLGSGQMQQNPLFSIIHSKIHIQRIDPTQMGNINNYAKEIFIYFNKYQTEVVLVDTLTMISNYFGDNMKALQFAHTLIHNLRETGINCLFPFPIEKKSVELGRDLQMFADGVVILK